MLMNGSSLLNYPVLSLHVGGPIARTSRPIIDPHSLKIIAYEILPTDLLDEEAGNILETRDIREFSNIGMIVDSGDCFVNRGDVIKLDKIIELNFDLVGLKVETKKEQNSEKLLITQLTQIISLLFN